MVVFANRVDAGRRLARELASLRGQDLVVLGLPRGGVPVAYEVAAALDAPLDVIVVRKLGVPFQPELAMGAIGEGGARVVDHGLVARARVSEQEFAAVERRERALLESRVQRLRRGRGRVALEGRTAVVVDDGMATGSTARAACQVARHLGAGRVVLAVPVAAAETVRDFAEADQVVCVSAPEWFGAVGAFYNDFSPITDDEVIVLLDAAQRRMRRAPVDATTSDCIDADVVIPVGQVVVEGHLNVPDEAAGIVLFAHGSGSGRHSPRNRFVAEVLQRAGMGTLLLDLLTVDEERDRTNVFDIDLLAGRLTAATRWLRGRLDTASYRLGYFGASTGAGAALWAAAEQGQAVSAVVSRGGRPDLAGPRLAQVSAPTLLIVGGADWAVLDLNRQARTQLRCVNELAVVAGATHLFEEPGTLAEAANLASEWFCRYLCAAETARSGVAAS